MYWSENILLKTFFSLFFFKKSQKIKKGIVLKCQGNPVSCYGKRSAPVIQEPIHKQLDESQTDTSFNLISDEQLEASFERKFEALMSTCKQGSKKACNTLLKIMIMNSD